MKERLPRGTLRLYTRAAANRFLPGYEPILRRVPVGAKSILDLGCGPGYVADRLAKLHPHADIVGADKDPAMLRIARRRHPPDPRLRFDLVDAADMPFADGAFDLVWTSEAFHHFADKDATMKEVLRVLRPGGEWWIVETRADMGRREFRQTFKFPALPGVFGLARFLARSHGYTDVGLAKAAQRLVVAGFADSRVDHHGAWGRVIGHAPTRR